MFRKDSKSSSLIEVTPPGTLAGADVVGAGAAGVGLMNRRSKSFAATGFAATCPLFDGDESPRISISPLEAGVAAEVAAALLDAEEDGGLILNFGALASTGADFFFPLFDILTSKPPSSSSILNCHTGYYLNVSGST